MIMKLKLIFSPAGIAVSRYLAFAADLVGLLQGLILNKVLQIKKLFLCFDTLEQYVLAPILRVFSF